MKATAKKSSTTSATATRAASQPFFAKAGGGSFFVPANGATASVIQMKMAVNKPGDKFEQEADRMADKVMRMPTPASPEKEEKLQRQPEDKLQKKEEEKLQKAPASEDKLQRKGSDGTPSVGANVQSAIQNKTTGGQPLGSDARSFMESRFNADFGNVRIHTDAESASLNNQLSARAFTYQNHIFFSRNQYQPGTSEGKQLLAHELTHTIQQGHAIQRSPQVSTTTTPPAVQRLGFDDALAYMADRVHMIPGFRMFTIVLGVNPITMERVDRSPANIMRAVVEFMPGGILITQALDNHGVFSRVSDWVAQQFRSLALTGSAIREAIVHFLNGLTWRDIFHPADVWRRAQRIITEPIDQLVAFAGSLATGVLRFIKDAILMPLARLAEGINGWDLLCAVLGRNPISGEVVPRNAETLIGGFMRLIGQEEVWENIKRGNAVARAWAWFQGALAGVMAFVQQIPALFVQTLRTLEIADIVLVPRALARVVGVFGNFASRFFSWAGGQVMSLLQIIFEVVAPQVMVYIRRAGGALQTIIRNPMGFVGNLIDAGKLGLRRFAANFLTHLRTSLIGWLTGAMSGANIYIPQALTLQEIVKFILSVLGLTWQNIRTKLVRVMGEPVVAGLERGFDLVMTLVREGPAAAWDKIVESITNLREMVMGQIMEFVESRIVQSAITTLVSSLVPGAGFIRAIISMYDTVMFFVERFRQIAQVATAFIDSIASIASGVISAAANRVEQTMAGMLTLVISFLARIARLGNVTQAITNIINRVRQPIDRALDRVVHWIQQRARSLASRMLGGDPNMPSSDRVANAMREAVPVVNRHAGRPVGATILRPLLMPIKLRHRLTRLDVVARGNVWAVAAAASPEVIELTTAQVDGSSVAGITSRINYTSGTLADRVVGKEMVADPLGPDHPMGQEPVGDNVWRSILVTDPAKPNDRKYIRGHLLNHHIGGTGTAQNLFPITAAANATHERQIERQVKRWVNDERKWVYYRVQVTNINSHINPDGPIANNKIDAHFVCAASVIDLSTSRRHNTISATIVSHYQPPPGTAIVINQSTQSQEEIAARPEDLAATILTPVRRRREGSRRRESRTA